MCVFWVPTGADLFEVTGTRQPEVEVLELELLDFRPAFPGLAGKNDPFG